MRAPKARHHHAQPRGQEREFPMDELNIAVLIPCYNEAKTIGHVVRDFAQALPSATIYVFDNNSTDQTSQVADHAGAVVKAEVLQGKGHVVRRMFSDIEADVYVLVDGDGTYDAPSASHLVQLLVQGPYDMVNAARQESSAKAYRTGHKFGNRMLSALVAFFLVSALTIFCRAIACFPDVLSNRFPLCRPVLKLRRSSRCTRWSCVCRWWRCPRRTGSDLSALIVSCTRFAMGCAF